MKNSLWEQFGNIEYDRKKNTSYYNIMIEGDKLFQQNANVNCTQFVKKHFNIGEKHEASIGH